MKYSEPLMGCIRQRLGLEETDTSKDQEIERMTPREVFDHRLCWEGIIGYSGTILGWVKEIYKVDLDF